MLRNYGFVVCITSAFFFLFCFPEDPPLPNLLDKPELQFVGLTVVGDDIGGYAEAIHVRWSFSRTDETPLHSFTLLRKLPQDSVEDVFSGSRLIPPDTLDFFDELAGYSFPEDAFDSIVYRIVAVDTFGRTGDTSDYCIVLIAPQPILIGMNTATGCCNWKSWIRGGGVSSWCRVWHDGGPDWTSSQTLQFPNTDEPALFEACLPDSLAPLAAGRWRYALFVKASELYSLATGAIDVP